MAKLHSQLNELATDYERLWNNVHAADAALGLDNLIRRDREISEAAATEAPNDQKRMRLWEEYIFKQHGLPIA